MSAHEMAHSSSEEPTVDPAVEVGVKPETPIRLASYDVAYRRFLQNAFQGYAEDNELFKDIELVKDRHAGPIRNVRTETPFDQPMVEMSAGMTIERAAMRATDVDAHTGTVHGFATEMLAEQSRQFFANMGAMTDAAGMTVRNDGQGAPTIEQFRELLQRMDLAFDEDGKIQQTLVVHPSQSDKATALLAAVNNDPECQRIVAEKRREWMELRAARSRRTLSR